MALLGHDLQYEDFPYVILESQEIVADEFDADYGSVEVGKIANLLVLKAGPSGKVSAYREIDRLVLRGKLIERGTLAAD